MSDGDLSLESNKSLYQIFLFRSGIETFGKNAVVVGRSKNVGMPMAMLLHADGRNETHAMDATTTICHRFTPPEQLAMFCKTADIIVTATGKNCFFCYFILSHAAHRSSVVKLCSSPFFFQKAFCNCFF